MNFFTALFSSRKRKKPEPKAPLKILFIIKKRTMPFYGTQGGEVSTGLYNSARFVVELLEKMCNVLPKIVDVVDNNCIDREVSLFNPDIVIIEALWVVPEKFDVLRKLHPKVKWVVRLHSEIPFIAHEGIAMQWINEYTDKDVIIGVNSPRLLEEISFLVGSDNVAFMPNAYTFSPNYKTKTLTKRPVINIGCFGAVRPLKNHLIQAIAAIRFADENDLTLNFHINGNRCEEKSEGALKNVRQLFAPLEHNLVEHPWMNHDDFLETIACMDISMQVSFSETFNIVTADAINKGIPVLVSPEVAWVDERYHAEPTSSADIVRGLNRVYIAGLLGKHKTNQRDLINYNEASAKAWKEFLHIED